MIEIWTREMVAEKAAAARASAATRPAARPAPRPAARSAAATAPRTAPRTAAPTPPAVARDPVAVAIAGLCLASDRPELACEFIERGFSIEQAKAALLQANWARAFASIPKTG